MKSVIREKVYVLKKSRCGFEIHFVTEEWDKDSEFDATIYFHMINFGWKTLS